MSEDAGEREQVAWLLWQVNEGYITAEDRAIGTNWFLSPVGSEHPDAEAERPHWLALADEVVAILSATSEHHPEAVEVERLTAERERLQAHLTIQRRRTADAETRLNEAVRLLRLADRALSEAERYFREDGYPIARARVRDDIDAFLTGEQHG